jgi:signal transduction histidine kinase
MDDRHLAEALDQTRLLGRLVEDLRTMANAEIGILSLQKEPTDLPILIRDVVNALSRDASDQSIVVTVDAPPELPAIVLDPLRIREVLINLLSNSLRHTPPAGQVTIAARGRSGQIIITVTDTGSGIAPEDLPRVFDRFYKGRTSRGSGLGLTIARNLVVAHGGSIRADSAAGRGTTMTVILP